MKLHARLFVPEQASSPGGGTGQPPKNGVERGFRPEPVGSLGPHPTGPVHPEPELALIDNWNRCRYCGKSLPNSKQRNMHEKNERRWLGLP